MRIDVLNGVNLDVVGLRDPALYGGLSLDELETRIYDWAGELGCTVRCRQTNHEGEFVEAVPRRGGWTVDGIDREPGRLGALQLGDPGRARACPGTPIVEVHLSNVDEREEWRRFSVLEGLTAARFVGKGPEGYREALEFLVQGAMTRIERLAALLEEPLLVAGPPYVLGGQANVRYLTGLASSNAALLVEPDATATLYADFRYAARGRAVEGVTFVETPRGLLPAVGELLSGRRIGFEEAHLPYAGFRALADAGVDAVPTDGLVESLRAVKDADEIASRCAVPARSRTRSSAGSPSSGSQAAASASSRGGSSGASVRPGPRASRSRRSSPPARPARARTPIPGNDPIEEGVLVTVDAGCVVDGYCSDCTRTFAVGAISDRLSELYALCLEAQLAGLAAVGPGVHGRDPDAASRAPIEVRRPRLGVRARPRARGRDPDPREPGPPPGVDGRARAGKRRLRRARDLRARRGRRADRGSRPCHERRLRAAHTVPEGA